MGCQINVIARHIGTNITTNRCPDGRIGGTKYTYSFYRITSMKFKNVFKNNIYDIYR